MTAAIWGETSFIQKQQLAEEECETGDILTRADSRERKTKTILDSLRSGIYFIKNKPT